MVKVLQHFFLSQFVSDGGQCRSSEQLQMFSAALKCVSGSVAKEKLFHMTLSLRYCKLCEHLQISLLLNTAQGQATTAPVNHPSTLFPDLCPGLPVKCSKNCNPFIRAPITFKVQKLLSALPQINSSSKYQFLSPSPQQITGWMTLGSGIPAQALGISTSYLLAFELLKHWL